MQPLAAATNPNLYLTDTHDVVKTWWEFNNSISYTLWDNGTERREKK